MSFVTNQPYQHRTLLARFLIPSFSALLAAKQPLPAFIPTFATTTSTASAIHRPFLLSRASMAAYNRPTPVLLPTKTSESALQRLRMLPLSAFVASWTRSRNADANQPQFRADATFKIMRPLGLNR
ncbi:hypothetical protein BDZ88DRAFT_413926 [Geranomyces variabilis]|nr:hypothetical protein BDZ88DRAFT_413926 [Geranomyces variabilis]KAJ3137109.1 hypothetical protein HDU90_002280 [Geranomyces variabilis]